MGKRKRRSKNVVSEEVGGEKSENNAPVTFNVGGTKYEVSRSLLDQYPDTMLSRMVSEEWQQGNDIFIERNGARFAFVLDYMRDGSVSLPCGGNSVCTKSSLLAELTYFGFEDVSEDAITIEFSHLDATKCRARLTEDFQREREVLVERKKQLEIDVSKVEIDIACLTVAHAICVRRMTSETESIRFCIAYLSSIRQKPSPYVAPYSSTPTKIPKYKRAGSELDRQVLEAVNATSLASETDALNRALLKF